MQQRSLYHLLSWNDSRLSFWWSFSLEVPLVVLVIANEALFWNDCNFWWKAKAVHLVMYNITMVKMRPYKQFRGSRQNIRELLLQTCFFTYSFTRQKKYMKIYIFEDINGGSSHKNVFLEISVPKQLTKSWKINVEKFTFSCTEA